MAENEFLSPEAVEEMRAQMGKAPLVGFPTEPIAVDLGLTGAQQELLDLIEELAQRAVTIADTREDRASSAEATMDAARAHRAAETRVADHIVKMVDDRVKEIRKEQST